MSKQSQNQHLKMKKIIFASALVLSAIIVSTTTRCSEEEVEEVVEQVRVNPEFATYIRAYSSGLLSVKSNIRIEFLQDFVDEVNTEEPIDDRLFTITPMTSGEAFWVNKNTIEFRPDNDLRAGQDYKVDFALDKILDVPSTFGTFSYNFSTLTQHIRANSGKLVAEDFNDLKKQTYTTTIYTNDIADAEDVEECVTAKQNGNKLDIEWTHINEKSHAIVVKGIKRGDKEGSFEIELDGKPIDADETNAQEIEIPALGDFKVTDIEVVHEPEQYVSIHFSDPLKSDQYLMGLIEIDDMSGLTYTIDGQEVQVFLPHRVSGTKTVTINPGVKNINGYKMFNSESVEMVFEGIKPDIKLVEEGVIVPSNKHGLLYPFEAVNVRAVDVFITKIYENNMLQFLQINNIDERDEMKRVSREVLRSTVRLDNKEEVNLHEWNRFNLDVSDIIEVDPGAIYQIELRIKKDFSVYGCGDEETAQLTSLSREQEKEWNEKEWVVYDYWYDDEYWRDAGDYNYRERDNPCHATYFYNKSIKSNMLASNIGLIAKAGDNKELHIFANDILTTNAIANAKIEFYSYQQQKLGEAITNSQGMASIKMDEKPFVVIAKHGKQRAYLKLRDGESLSLSKFDVSGATIQNSVKGFVYAERGVWRPGDSLFVSFMLEDKDNVLPKNHPVSFTLYDPNYQVVEKRTISKNLNGLYDFRTATDEDAPTGNYLAEIKVGNREFTKNLKVETVKPNRLKIYLDFANEFLSKTRKDDLAELSVKWLHGATAGNLGTRVDLTLNKRRTSFKGYPSFIFDDPIKDFSVEEQTVFDSKVDDSGKASFKPSIYIGSRAPGMLTANFVTKVFEKGGGFSIDRKSIPYSPFESYVGIDVPEGSLEYGTIQTDQDVKIDVVNLKEDGSPVKRSELEVKVYKVEWRWWWDSYDNDLASYIAKSTTVAVQNEMIDISNGKGKFNFRINRPEWGRYLILVKDKESGHSTGKIVYVDWPYWARSERTTIENVTMLSFSTDKESYNVGEKVKLSFPSAEKGKAIVSLESGTKIVKKFLIDTEKGETNYEFETTEEMSPNVFVHVTLLQPHNVTENDLPIRMYGVAPIMVENPNSHLNPLIACADEFKPESTTRVKVSEKSGKPMTYTLAVVDEGLLDLTSFKTPQPWDHFYAREALGVKTWDLYDDIMGAYAIEMNKILAVGGDGSGKMKKPNKANRFKPMVRFIGPFYLPAGSTKSHKIDIPNYVGSVRVMVVAGHEEAYGNAEKAVPVRSPLMVLGTLPRVLSPTEQVYLPVNVFAMKDGVKDVSVEIKTNDLLKIQGSRTKQIHFNKPGDEVINFGLNVAEKIGIAKVEIIARSGNHTAHHTIELDVRTPNPAVVDVQEKVLMPGDKWNASVKFNGIEGTNSTLVELSSFPPINLGNRLKYLIQYPHGCIEQTTSAAFPQLALHKLMKLDKNYKNSIQSNVMGAINRISLMQTTDGGFGYWPGMSESDEWGSNYAGHFLLEADLNGYKVPNSLKNGWVKYQRRQAREFVPLKSPTIYEKHKNLVQAYRLYTLALARKAELGAMNRLRETPGLDVRCKWRLAAAYQLVGQTEVAKKLTKNLSTEIEAYNELSYTYGSDLRDEAMILETMVLMGDKDKSAGLAKEVAERLNADQWMSTQTTAYCLIAMAKFAGEADLDKTMRYTVSMNSKLVSSKATQVPIVQHEMKEDGIVEVENVGQGPMYVKVVTEGVPVIGDQTEASNHVAMRISYKKMNGEELDASRIEQGTDFIAQVTISHGGTRANLREMTLNQLFPSGWEIHNSRMDGYASSSTNSHFDYQDIRDDRVYTYYDLSINDTKTYTIKLNATYLGKFYLPTVITEAMYDNTVHARVPGFWTEVVKQSSDVAISE